MAAVVYVDSSAWLKTVVSESESDAVTEWAIGTAAVLVSSMLLYAEVHGAVRRRSDGYDPAQVQAALDRVAAVDVRPGDLLAVVRSTRRLRTADGIHLATAERVGADAMLVYDSELADAAASIGLAVIAPA